MQWQRSKGKQMAGLQRFRSHGYWQDAELEKLTFRGFHTAATVGSRWIPPSPSRTISLQLSVNLFVEVEFSSLVISRFLSTQLKPACNNWHFKHKQTHVIRLITTFFEQPFVFVFVALLELLQYYLKGQTLL